MRRTKPLPEGLYCPHPACSLFGQVEECQLERHAYYGLDQKVIYLCRACRKTFSETRGTFFFGLRTPRQKILTALAMIAEQGGIRATGRAMGVDKDTIQMWVERAGRHVEEVSAYLTVNCHLSEAQLDALWTFVKKKGQHLKESDSPEESGDFFVWRCVKRDTKLRLASHVGKNDEEGAKGLLIKVKERMAKANDPLLADAGDPLFVSDGDVSIPPAMLAVFGQPLEEPVHRGPKWKYPRREPDENVIFLRAIKQRDETGRLLGIVEEVTWGDPDEVWQRIDPQGEGRHISTFCVERDNLTSRLHNSRLVRKTLRFSKQLEMLEAAVAWEDAYYNFCLPHDSLKRPLDPPRPTNGNGSPKKWAPRTPLMAEGVTDHVWTLV